MAEKKRKEAAYRKRRGRASARNVRTAKRAAGPKRAYAKSKPRAARKAAMDEAPIAAVPMPVLPRGGYSSNLEHNIKLRNTAVILFVIELILIFALSSIHLPSSAVSTLLSSYNQLKSQVDSQSYFGTLGTIFAHNFGIATLEFVPLFGAVMFLFSIAGTSLTIGAIGVSYSLPGALVMVSLLAVPSTWLELPAYAIAFAESIMLFRAGLNRTFRMELRSAIFVWIFVAIELAVAATFESAEIKLESVNPLYAFGMWIPFFIVIGIAYLAGRHFEFFRRG
ncbi:MAG: stage II sporulation protein M [Candidatus Micrarchaeales archaeon]|jgi:hypothetical protein|uniref:Stage II sporulation protein M n=1 Tax=Candidatus Micrarchaeum acidiphilum ARMAN-2 TaxID=425595 RepID=C7DG45_MICA2|nr:MAG: protein of unknown function DUF95 transmembrane [Candidatus Micrarchaeum acidiphilum ARMAN-2]MCW6161071.1 stage II sporulation protein M [Candidatus Micrarchaeales archaeon]